jgi:hypothetical protein
MTTDAKLAEALKILDAFEEELPDGETSLVFSYLRDEWLGRPHPSGGGDHHVQRQQGGRPIYDDDPAKNLVEVVRRYRKTSTKYDTTVFKCLSDYEKCLKPGTSKRHCQFALVISYGRLMLPFSKLI